MYYDYFTSYLLSINKIHIISSLIFLPFFFFFFFLIGKTVNMQTLEASLNVKIVGFQFRTIDIVCYD
jgi:hypothetical protein